MTICSYQRQPIFTVRAGLAPAPAINAHPINNVRVRAGLAPAPAINAHAINNVRVRAGLAPAPGINDHPINNVRVRAGLAPAPLTRIGCIIDEEWRKIPDLYSSIILDEYIIMPDHFHGIIMFADPNRETQASIALASGAQASCARASGSPGSGAQASCALTLGKVIASFKSRCTIRNLKCIKENHLDEIGKIWHRNYFEHIIRDEKELSEIRFYIRCNPIQWEKNAQNDISLLP